MSKTLLPVPAEVIEALKRARLCRDCRHSRPANLETCFHMTCAHPGVEPRNFATGAADYCFSVRGPYGRCGKDASLFAPKEVAEVIDSDVAALLEPLPRPKLSWFERLRVRIWKWVRS